MPARRMIIVAVLGCALLAAGFAPLAVGSPAYYVLKHPKKEHCKPHYRRARLLTRRRTHGRPGNVRRIVCVRVRHRNQPPIEVRWLTSGGAPSTESPFSGSGVVPIVGPPRPAHTCTTSFVGTEDSKWVGAANWTTGVPIGSSSFACIPPTYPASVLFTGNAASPTEIGGVAGENASGITLQDGALKLADPSVTSAWSTPSS